MPAPSQIDLSGRVAIVTGASRGIGRCIAVTLGRAGMAVAVAAKTVRDRQQLPGTIGETATLVEQAGGRALAVQVDVRQEADLDRLVEETLSAFGRIDALINNAGALWWRPVLDTPARRFDLVMSVNVRAAFLLSRQVAAAMRGAGRGGHIVMLSPPLDPGPHPGMVAYTISKLGMTLTAQGLAAELRSDGIAVNALWPATLIESLATINWGMGDRKLWRRPEIVADAVLALVRRDPAACTGRALLDEEVLREEGVTDFSRYRCVEDSEPPRVSYGQLADLLARMGGGGGTG